MSGFSLCNRLRRAPGLADVPVLLVPRPEDAAATEAHRSGKTPATDYLPPDAPPEAVLHAIQSLLGDAALEPEELSSDDLLPAEDELLGGGPAMPRPPSGPPPRPPSGPPSQSPPRPPTSVPRAAPGTAPPLQLRPRPADPFADLPPEPRLPMGASPDDKAAYFRDRVKAKDELLARVKAAWAQLLETQEGQDREAAGLRSSLQQALDGKRAAETALAERTAELQRASEGLNQLAARVKDA